MRDGATKKQDQARKPDFLAERGADVAKKKFYAPVDFPEKAIEYADFITSHHKELKDLGGNTTPILSKVKKLAEQAKPLAKVVHDKQAELDKAKDAFHEKSIEGFELWMEQLEYARTYAKRHKLDWLEKGLAPFKAHGGGHGKGGAAPAGGTTPP